MLFLVHLDTLQVWTFDLSFLVISMLLLNHVDFLQCSWKPLLMGYRHRYCLISMSPKHEKLTFYIPYIFYYRNKKSFLFMLSFKLVKLWCLFLVFSDSVGVATKNIPTPGTDAELLLFYPVFGGSTGSQHSCSVFTTSAMNVQGKTEQLSYKLTWARVQWSKFTVMRSFNLIPETAMNRWGHILANECNTHCCCQEALV